MARGGVQCANAEGGAAGSGEGGGGDGGGGELLLLLEVAGMRERRGTGRRRRDGCRRRTKDLGLGRWRSGCVVAEVGRRRSAAADDMAGGRRRSARRRGGVGWVGKEMGNGVAWGVRGPSCLVGFWVGREKDTCFHQTDEMALSTEANAAMQCVDLKPNKCFQMLRRI